MAIRGSKLPGPFSVCPGARLLSDLGDIGAPIRLRWMPLVPAVQGFSRIRAGTSWICKTGRSLLQLSGKTGIMPELPDLEYIVSVLGRVLPGRRIEQVRVKNPIVLRLGVPGTLREV